jgi:hypothetical protein
MPRFKIPRITKPLDLRDYAPEFGDPALVEELGEPIIWVWVNPPASVRMELEEISEAMTSATSKLSESSDDTEESKKHIKAMQKAGEQSTAWWANMFSQYQDAETHWTADELQAFVKEIWDTDPLLWQHIQERCFELINEHRIGREKK